MQQAGISHEIHSGADAFTSSFQHVALKRHACTSAIQQHHNVSLCESLNILVLFSQRPAWLNKHNLFRLSKWRRWVWLVNRQCGGIFRGISARNWNGHGHKFTNSPAPKRTFDGAGTTPRMCEVQAMCGIDGARRPPAACEQVVLGDYLASPGPMSQYPLAGTILNSLCGGLIAAPHKFAARDSQR